jgi:iron only hydrogenase large subunit-like protein/uncharacterized Fe-S cluster-containing protein
MPDWVISTNRARCRDCYRCVRICPVKAVKVENGQAQIVPELCIACGSCARACPQKAKNVRDDRPAVKEAIAAGRTVVASIAPSAPAYFSTVHVSQMRAALIKLGFTDAGETATGAEMVGLAHRDVVLNPAQPQPVIASSCPVVVNLIERYYPDLIPNLAPLVSPMIAHGRFLRQIYGSEAYVVFIGPCIAKKEEILEGEVKGVMDAGLTFRELQEWMDEAGVTFPAYEHAGESVARVNARLFPVEGGLIATAKLDSDRLNEQLVATSGLDACQDVLRSIRAGELHACLVELLACQGGCINGPAMEEQESFTLARQRVLEYGSHRQPQTIPPREDWPALERGYQDCSLPVPSFSLQQIGEVLRKVDKLTPEDELNCGACGYATCRDKAVATLRGMAEATMCIPYMRRRAESLRQVVMDVTPNAILIVDTRLYIQDMSPSAERLLNCRLAAVAGKPLQTVISAVEGFARVRDTQQPIMNESAHLRGDLIVEQTIVPVEGQSLLVGIFRDVTDRERQHEQLERIRTETLSRTQEVVKNQMRVAHEIAQLLGETTAETKTMLSRLAKLLQEDKVE